MSKELEISDPIRAAVEQLQADLDALPERLAANPGEGIDGRWSVVGSRRSKVGALFRDGGSSFLAVANCANDDYGERGARNIAEHIARTASPHVTGALIGLLDTWHRHNDDNGCDCEDLVQCIDDVEIAFYALAEAITNRSTP